MKRILSLTACRQPAVRQRPRGCIRLENAKVTLVYQHELPNVPGKSIKGVLVEAIRAGRLLARSHAS